MTKSNLCAQISVPVPLPVRLRPGQGIHLNRQWSTASILNHYRRASLPLRVSPRPGQTKISNQAPSSHLSHPHESPSTFKKAPKQTSSIPSHPLPSRDQEERQLLTSTKARPSLLYAASEVASQNGSTTALSKHRLRCSQPGRSSKGPTVLAPHSILTAPCSSSPAALASHTSSPTSASSSRATRPAPPPSASSNSSGRYHRSHVLIGYVTGWTRSTTSRTPRNLRK